MERSNIFVVDVTYHPDVDDVKKGIGPIRIVEENDSLEEIIAGVLTHRRITIRLDNMLAQIISECELSMDRDECWPGRQEAIAKLQAAADAILEGWAQHDMALEKACDSHNREVARRKAALDAVPSE